MVTKCKNGHWFDPNVTRECPHCKRNGEKLSLQIDNVEEDDKTVSIADLDLSLGEQLGEIIGDAVMGMPDLGEIAGNEDDDDKTISFGFFGVTGVQPVTGWLVCQNGGEKGKDYRLRSGRNFVGRGNAMDVCLIDDKSISRNRHCSISYDPKGNAFYLAAEGGNTVYLNGVLIEEAEKLATDDEIMIGDTRLIFVEYCKEGRTWDKEEE
ncbi:MAG: FHA domain-containing protein [Roseburia sp.]|nr:FHA domain-containing protein [Roseburia sp.]